jgi:NCS1 family nucleobase:cation symporter-1
MVLIDPASTNAAVKIFNISFLIGLAIGFVVFWALCFISPPPHLGEGLDYLVS